MSVLSLPVVFSQSTSPCMELCSTFLSARFLGKTRKHWQVHTAAAGTRTFQAAGPSESAVAGWAQGSGPTLGQKVLCLAGFPKPGRPVSLGLAPSPPLL